MDGPRSVVIADHEKYNLGFSFPESCFHKENPDGERNKRNAEKGAIDMACGLVV